MAYIKIKSKGIDLEMDDVTVEFVEEKINYSTFSSGHSLSVERIPEEFVLSIIVSKRIGPTIDLKLRVSGVEE